METADTTEKMADTQPPSVTDADPNGDILLVVGPSDSAASLRISSKVLSLASPVFVVLFSRKFDGGRSAMATPTSSEPHRIALPEDDPEAMVVVCHALHFRPTRTDNGSLCLLEKVAVICDKYDLATALSGWSERALQCWKADTDGDAIQCMKLLCIAFVLGSHDAFWVVSWKLLYRCSKNYRFLYEESYPHPITLPEGLIRKSRSSDSARPS